MANRWVFTMLLFVAVVGSVSSLGTTAYGDDPYDAGPNPSRDSSIVDGILGFLGGVVGSILSFVEGFVPAFTGIWVIDDLIINPMIGYATYVGIKIARGA